MGAILHFPSTLHCRLPPTGAPTYTARQTPLFIHVFLIGNIIHDLLRTHQLLCFYVRNFKAWKEERWSIVSGVAQSKLLCELRRLNTTGRIRSQKATMPCLVQYAAGWRKGHIRGHNRQRRRRKLMPHSVIDLRREAQAEGSPGCLYTNQNTAVVFSGPKIVTKNLQGEPALPLKF